MLWLLAALLIYPAIVWYEASKEKKAFENFNMPGLTSHYEGWEERRNTKLKVYFGIIGGILFFAFMMSGASPSDRYL